METIDLHGMDYLEAKAFLDYYLSRQPKGSREIVVIHGHLHGRVLQRLVREEYRHPRIQRKL
ncbi:MAG: Smr/MutS family protein, partial [Erysipelotrichaceae bacterium]